MQEEKFCVLTAYKALLFREFGCCAEVFFFCFVRTTFCKVSGFWTCFALSFRIAGSFAFRRSLLDPTTYAIRDLNLIRLHELVGVKSDLAEPSSSLMTRVGFLLRCCFRLFIFFFSFAPEPAEYGAEEKVFCFFFSRRCPEAGAR